MTDHPTDDFDELLRSAARDYNRPGDAPRERMWTEIRAARARRAVPARPAGRRPIWFVPLAAAAVLVIGIAIGRLTNRTPPVTASKEVAVVDSQRAPIVNPPDSSTQPATDLSAPSAPPSAPDAQRSAPHPVRSAPAPSHPLINNDASLAYRLAVVEHLAGTEAMLTSFRAAAKRGEVDAQITNWAKNLLTTTRLLQSSAAQDDPTMKRLLDDLELVLVQIAQYSSTGAHHAEELDLIEHSIERRGVIGKLHTTIPARLVPAGT